MKRNILWAPIIVSILWMTCVAKPTVESNEDEMENLIPEDADIEFLNSYANKMKSYMNHSISPCDDFYEYACDVTDKLLTKTSLAIDLKYEEEMQIAQQVYNACVRAELQPLPATDPAYLALIKSIGGFPAVDGPEWQADKFNWFNMSAHLTNYGANGLINEKLLQMPPFAPYFVKPKLGFEYKVYSDNLATNETAAYKVNEQRMHTSKEVQSIIDELRKSLRVALQNADFLDTETRKEALKKESLIESHIGCLQDDEFTHRLIREMRNLSFVDGSYAQNHINLQRFKVYIDRFNGHHN
ncbi:uncharacterized protein [Drosophila tropicalis]|uniref:uncharacterized protein n=1 Tax=Drosophila tropicalis TaxID=46794 RepID=UPI0035ABC43D